MTTTSGSSRAADGEDLGAVLALADDEDVLLVRQALDQRGPDQGVVVDHEHADLARTGPGGVVPAGSPGHGSPFRPAPPMAACMRRAARHGGSGRLVHDHHGAENALAHPQLRGTQRPNVGGRSPLRRPADGHERARSLRVEQKMPPSARGGKDEETGGAGPRGVHPVHRDAMRGRGRQGGLTWTSPTSCWPASPRTRRSRRSTRPDVGLVAEGDPQPARQRGARGDGLRLLGR